MAQGYDIMATNYHDGLLSGCVCIGICRGAQCGLAEEEVAGLNGGDITSGEAVRVIAITGSDMLIGVPWND